MNKIISGIIVSFLISQSAYAGPGTGDISIKEIRAEKGMVYIFPANNLANSLDCGSASPIKLEPQDLGFDQMYSQALVAFTTDIKIKFWLRACVDSPWGRTVPKAYASGISK